MKTPFRWLSSTLLAAVIALAGCSDGVTGPGANEFLLGSTLDNLLPSAGDEVTVIERHYPLERDFTATRTIGPRGGYIAIPEAGLIVRFPIGAVSERTEITVTAPAGDLVGYHFAPHGLEFDRSPTIVQSLLGTTGFGKVGSLFGAYFQGDLAPTIEALEILDLQSGSLGLVGWFRIDHFSGYVVATD